MFWDLNNLSRCLHPPFLYSELKWPPTVRGIRFKESMVKIRSGSWLKKQSTTVQLCTCCVCYSHVCTEREAFPCLSFFFCVCVFVNSHLFFAGVLSAGALWQENIPRLHNPDEIHKHFETLKGIAQLFWSCTRHLCIVSVLLTIDGSPSLGKRTETWHGSRAMHCCGHGSAEKCALATLPFCQVSSVIPVHCTIGFRHRNRHKWDNVVSRERAVWWQVKQGVFFFLCG